MELWSSERAAEYFGVSPGRARSLLNSRGFHRISGYPAAAVRAVHLRQGHRTDLHPVDLDTALSIADTAPRSPTLLLRPIGCACSSSSCAVPMPLGPRQFC